MGEKAQRARQHVQDILDGKARWTVRIPASPRDSDCIIFGGLAELETERDALRKKLDGFTCDAMALPLPPPGEVQNDARTRIVCCAEDYERRGVAALGEGEVMGEILHRQYDEALAENDRLRARIAELEADLETYRGERRAVLDDACPTDERHCACVPELRGRIAELEAESDVSDTLLQAAEAERDALREELGAVRAVAERCERWTTPNELGAQFANGREGAFRDCAMWLRRALGEGE